MQLLPEAVELPAEAERDRAAGIAGAVLDPEAQVLPVSDGPDVAELAARHEQGDAGISETERRQARELGAEIQRQFRAVHERIDHGPRPELLLGQIRIGVRREGDRERLNLSGLDREPGRRAVTPEADELLGTGRETAVEVEAAGGTARAFPLALAARDQDHRPVEALDEARGDDADHALVPALAGDDVSTAAALLLGPRRDLGERVAQDPLLDRLPVAVELVEAMGEPGRLVAILRQQQLERRLGMAEPPRRVQSRRDPKADRGSVGCGRIDPCDLHQLAQARFLCARERPQARDRQAAVLVDERDNVRDRRDPDQIEVARQRFRLRPEKGLAELEDDAGAAELAERVHGLAIRPDERAVRELLGGTMMVADDDLESERLGCRDLGGRGDPAIDRQDETAAVVGQPRERLAADAVALVEAARQVPLDLGPELPQDQNGERGRADAVGVVVAVHADATAARDRGPNCLTCGRHVPELERVVRR